MPLGLGRRPGTQGQFNHPTRFKTILRRSQQETASTSTRDCFNDSHTPRAGHRPELDHIDSIELVCQPELTEFYRRWGFTDAVGTSQLMRRTSNPHLGVTDVPT
jgi:hypothetical protein